MRTEKEIRDRIKSILAERDKYHLNTPSDWELRMSFDSRITELVWVLNQK